ncbi:MAG: hypothetical protein AAF721_03070 [Myxococcota bacterium]
MGESQDDRTFDLDVLRRDAELARERGITLEVNSKAGPSAPWEPVGDVFDQLELAMERARAIVAYETSVITAGPGPNRGFIYWTSRDPDILGSSILTIPFE